MANQLMPSNPVGAFLQGRQYAQGQQDSQQQNQLRQMQIQQAQEAQGRDAQFRQALPAYLQGGTNGLAALYAADPERAMQAQQFQTQQNQFAQAQQTAKAKQAHAQAEGVLASEAPATYLRLLIPDVAKQWSSHNGKDAEEMTDEEALALAQQVSTVARAQAGMLPPGEGEAFTLGEGQTRFDSRGKAVASVGKAPPAPTAEDVDRPFKRANILRDEYDTQSKDYRASTDAYQRVLSASKDPSAAGDLALIFAFMRTLDPGSTVREGEFATATNAGGVDSRIRAQYNKVISGERLAPEQRKDFVTKAGQLWQGQKEIDAKRRSKYSKLAERAGADPQDVLGDEVSVDIPVNVLGVGQSTSLNGFTVKRKK